MRNFGWRLVAHEWLVIPNKEEYGKGDLVFRSGRKYMVIECKRRTNDKVYEQAKFYAAAWKLRYAEPHSIVLYGIVTCDQRELLGVVRTKKEAIKLCPRDICDILLL